MADDFLQTLLRFDRHAAALQAALGDATAAPPERLEATDSTGTIRVVLGPDGFPESMSVGADWRRTVGSEGLGAAVGEACRAASDQRSAAWAQSLAERGTLATVEAFEQRLASESLRREPITDPMPVSLVGRLPAQPRAVHAVVADIFRTTDALTGSLTLAPSTAPSTAGDDAGDDAAATGSSAFGRLVLTLSAGGAVSCTADPHWVSRQETGELSDALNRALTAALAERRTAAGESPSAALTGLLAELLAALRSA